MKEFIKNIFKVFLGICLGIIALVAFVYFGGSKYVTEVGRSTIRLGAELEKYERPIKDKAVEAEKTVNKTVDVTKETVNKTVDVTKDTVGKVKESVNKAAPKKDK